MVVRLFLSSNRTFDVERTAKVAQWLHLQERPAVLEADLERIAVVQLEVRVDVQPQVRLDVLRQAVHDVLDIGNIAG